MGEPLTWLQTFYFVIGSAGLFLGLLVWCWVYYAFGRPLRLKPPPKERDWEKDFNWQPELEPTPEVHVLGSDYPQTNGTFLRHLVSRPYTVPKDPEAYAKIFVPTKDRKGSAE